MQAKGIEFYPTPDVLADKMVSLIHGDAQTILEPSAGTGSLIKAILRKNNKNYRNSFYRIDYCELESTLSGIINEYFRNKDLKVFCVCDNFILYNIVKRYDVILMNPPFSNAEEHIIKAIEIQERWGGQVIALCNAETLRNPFSNKRKLLRQKLDQYGASFEYISNAFSCAENKTNVEVALINLEIPKKVKKTDFISNMKKSFVAQKQLQTEQIVRSGDEKIEGMIQQFEFEVKIGTELSDLYFESCPYIMSNQKHYSKPIIELCCEGQPFNINTYIEQTRQKYWCAFFTNDEFTGKLTSNLKEDFMKEIDVMKDYDFNHFNVDQLLKEISKRMEKAYHDTILSLFDKLSCYHSYSGEPEETNVHYFNGWKNNKSWKINDKRVILPFYNVFRDYFGFNSYEAITILSDIEKILFYLDDSEVEPLTTDWENKLSPFSGSNESIKNIESKYFFIDIYKKGTCHIKWKDKRIVDKLNLYGSMRRGWLPPSYGNKTYTDMDAEEKSVIDAFQGKKAYSEALINHMRLKPNFINTEVLMASSMS